MTMPAVAAWPPSILADEPVHGFFQRLAECNGQISCRTFAAHLGLNGRNYDFDELLQFSLSLPVGRIDDLVDATPRRSLKAVTLRGQTFSPVHFAFTQVRICSACVAESRHHRNWFDLAFLQNCPMHDLPLVDGSGGEKLARWHPPVGVLPHSGLDLAKPSPRVAPPATLSRYVLGRLGCAPCWQIPYLDRYDCGEIIQASEVIGRMGEFGWAPKLNTHGKWDARRRRRTEDGFTVLRHGADSVLGALSQFTAGSPTRPSSTTISFANEEFYGWLVGVSRDLAKLPLGSAFQSLMREHANQSGVFARRGYQLSLGRTGSETLSSLARKLGINHPKAKDLAARVGVLRPVNDKGQNHSFSAEECASILEVWEDLVTREEADRHAKDAGLGDLATFEVRGLIKPFVRVGGGTPPHDRFRRSDLNRLGRRLDNHRRSGRPVRAVQSGDPPTRSATGS